MILFPVAWAGEVAVIWILIFLAMLIFGKSRERKTAVLFMLTIILVDRLIAPRLGDLFDRPRPYVALAGIRQVGVRWTSGSFVSGHAHSVCIAAIILGSRYRKLIWPLVVFAVLTCYSRPYFGMHYPMDTLAGAALGTASGFAALAIEKLYARRKAGRKP